jgi:hypothetical protein
VLLPRRGRGSPSRLAHGVDVPCCPRGADGGFDDPTVRTRLEAFGLLLEDILEHFERGEITLDGRPVHALGQPAPVGTRLLLRPNPGGSS